MRRIFIVDDDPLVCLAIRTWLNRYSFTGSIAGGGINGLVALDRSAFDLMIVAADPDFPKMALEFGATRCLRKPFKPATLLGVVDRCLSEGEPYRKHVVILSAVASACRTRGEP